MSNKNIYNKWIEFINDDKYKKYFLDNETIWIDNLEKIKKYIDENNKRPSCNDKNNKIKSFGTWICHQQKNYKNKKEIMSNEYIYNKWTEFINNYNKFF